MLHEKTKTGLYCIGFLAVVGLLYAFSTKDNAEYQKLPQSEWENLQVLPQDISKDSLKTLMKSYTVALGVKCAFCHAPREDNPEKLDFASDAKRHKLIARGMIKMTMGINENYFKPHYPDPKPDVVIDVSCITCHRGSENPRAFLERASYFYQNITPGEKHG